MESDSQIPVPSRLPKMSEVIQLEGKDDWKRYQIISELAKKHFEGTALVENKPWTQEDVEKTKQFLLEGAPFAHPKVWPNFWEHIVTTSLMAKIYAQKLADDSILNPLEAEVVGLLHDASKIIRPNRYLRPNLIEDVLFRRVNIRPQVLEKIASVPAIIGLPPNPIRRLEDVSIAQVIQDVTDNMGKLKGGKLLTIEDIKLSMRQREVTRRYSENQDLLWPSERKGIEARRSPDENRGGRTGEEFASQLLLDEIDYLKEKYGIDFEDVRRETEEELWKAENQGFILQLKNAQETLDPEVDRLLGRPPIKTMVFDIGNVLLDHLTDDEIFRALAEKLGILNDERKRQKFFQAVKDYTPKSQTGELSGEEYLQKLWEAGEVEFPGAEEAIDLLWPDELYKPYPGMREIIEALSKNGIDIWCLSDVASAISPRQLAKMKELYPWIDPSHILQSSELGVSKGNKGSFQKLLERLGSVARGSVLFIDNKEEHTTTARSRYDIRAITFREDPFARQTPTDRLRRELAKAGLV